MKSIVTFVAALLAAAMLTACGGDNDATGPASTNTTAPITQPTPAVDIAPTELLDRIHQISVDGGIVFPSLETMELTTDDTVTFAYLFGIEPTDATVSAAISQPIIGSIAYTVGVIKLADPSKAQDVADAVKSGVDPSRWVCVTASVVRTAYVGDTVLLIMDTDTARADSIMSAFKQVMQAK